MKRFNWILLLLSWFVTIVYCTVRSGLFSLLDYIILIEPDHSLKRRTHRTTLNQFDVLSCASRTYRVSSPIRATTPPPPFQPIK